MGRTQHDRECDAFDVLLAATESGATEDQAVEQALASDCIPVSLHAISALLDQWARRAKRLRAQADEAPKRTAADRGVVLALHHEADAMDACRAGLAAMLAGGKP